jgi:aminoglycoside 3-N-acetyltransferase I
MNIQYIKLNSSDLQHFIDLVRVYEDVFEMQNFSMPDAVYLQSMLDKESVIIYVALFNGVVVGGLTAHILPSPYSPPGEVYIYDLAIKTEMQRKGIGKNLISALKEYTIQIGYNEIFVQTDVIDRHALDFYKAIGGIAEDVIHFTYSLK